MRLASPSTARGNPILKALTVILKALTVTYREKTSYSRMLRCSAALRIMLFPRTIYQFNSMNLIEKLRHPTGDHDPLYFIDHRYYISKQFTLRQRIDVAMGHHKYELQAYNPDYVKQVYELEGILLWQRCFDDLKFHIVLAASADHRAEGDLTVILSVNNIRLSSISFCYLNTNIFGLKPNMTMMISRIQAHQTSDRERFDRHFKQNTPQLFCLNAVCGIAMANGFETMFAIKHDAQIHYEEHQSGFRNSYTELWEKFDAVEVNGHVYMLNVPLKLRPIELVNPAHRRRARARRRYWDDIFHSARQSMVKYRT